MNKERADLISQKIAQEWKHFWMNQKQNSKEDYDNYFRRAFGIDANMRCHLEDKISQALIEAFNEGVNYSYEVKKCLLKDIDVLDAKLQESLKAKPWPDENDVMTFVNDYMDRFGYRPNEWVTILWLKNKMDGK